MSLNQEVIQIYVGQAGIQLANTCWEIFCLEHGIQPDGYLYKSINNEDTDLNFNSFYNITPACRCVPRAILVDLDCSTINDVKTGHFKELFQFDSLLSGKEDCANNYARGYYTIGREILELTMDRIRKLIDNCSSLQGFIIYHSIGGGTGSGFTSLLLENLKKEFPKKVKMDFTIFPSAKVSSIVVEPYNSVLACHTSMDSEDIVLPMDNQAMYDILINQLEVGRPAYINLNRLVAQIAANLTSSLRFQGSINSDMYSFLNNLVPYPRIHYPLVTHTPLIPVSKSYHEELSVAQLTNACFEPNYQLVKCEPRAGKILACCLLYRGEVTPVDVNNAIINIKIKRKDLFANWSQTGFKVGINYQTPCTIPGGDLARVQRTVTMVSTNTAINAIWKRLIKKFNLMYKSRAFMHHYTTEGMEEEEFVEAKENLLSLIQDYNEATD